MQKYISRHPETREIQQSRGPPMPDDDPNYSRRDWATLIRAVRTPLSLFTLALLIAQAILLGLAQRAVGRDFTILLSATLALTFVLVIVVAISQFRSQAK